MREPPGSLASLDGQHSPLLANIVLFARSLRPLGLIVSTAQVAELAAALDDVRVTRADDVRITARCLFVHRHSDLEIFDRAWREFWQVEHSTRPDLLAGALNELRRTEDRQAPDDGRSAPTSTSETARQESLQMSRRQLDDEEDQSDDDNDDDAARITIYSQREALRARDFAQLTDDELTDAQRFLAEMRWTVGRRRTRRTRPASRGQRPDIRRSLRRSLGHGGEMLSLAYRGATYKRRQLVLLCDISGSMERYSRLLLHFLHSVERSIQQVEVFVFATRLTRITHELRGRDPDVALRAATAQVQDWSGGTRIGESLRTFNRQWSRRVLEHGAIVLIISDGWDRGDPGLLSAEMARLQRQSYRLLWLNPLLGAEGYQPVTQGIRAALPYVDDFLPVHNLHSLEGLARVLNQIEDGRPDRRQGRHHPEGNE